MCRNPDAQRPDAALDSGMDTGSDDQPPGEWYPPEGEETAEVLHALREPGPHPWEPAVEDSPEAATAAADEAPMPALRPEEHPGGEGGDGRPR